MADKRISQLVERTDIANNDVVPIVASGATTTNKATISSIQEFMQENLDLGVTSVGITLGTTGTDVSVSGSPITTSGNITINLPTASATNRGLLSAADWTTFNNKQAAGSYVTLNTAQTITAQKVFTTSGSSDSVIITHGSGSGFALDVIKAGNGEAIRVTKTSGSGNAMSITGGNFGAEDATFSGTLSTTPDAVINGVNVGKGGGSVATNVRVGNQTLTFNTTGSSNTSVGFSSLYFNTTGSLNTSIGTGSLQANTTGGSNTSVGVNSLLINTSGTQNTSTGASALFSNTIGNSNTVNGFQASFKNTTGNNNVAVGLNSLFGNTTGTSNTALGHGAGHYITNDAAENSISNNSVFIGSQTKAQANNQTNQIVIGHLTTGNGSNTVTIGNSSITSNFLNRKINLKGTNSAISSIEYANPSGTLHWTLQTNFGASGEQQPFSIRNAVLGQDAILIQHASNNVTINGSIATITGNLSGTGASFSSDVQTSTRFIAANPAGEIRITPNLSGTTNRIESFGSLPFSLTSIGAITLAAGGTTPQITLGTGGAVTLTGALNGTSASFTGNVGIATAATISGADSLLLLTNTSTNGKSWRVESSSSGALFFTQVGVVNALQLAPSTGAATFSSSVNARNLELYRVDGGVGLEVNGGDLGPGSYIARFKDFSNNARVVITGNGRLGIGTVSPNVGLHVSGVNEASAFDITNTTASTGKTFRIASQSTGNLVFEDISAGTERMRITSEGFLKASNTGSYIGATGAYHEIRTNQADQWATLMSNSSSSPYVLNIRHSNSSPNNADNWFIFCEDSTTSRFRVASNGNVTNTNGSYGSISDIKLKENITDATPKLDDLLKVKIRNYNLIGEETKQIGVIAQELEEVFPAMVDESEDFEEVEVAQLDEEGNEVLNEEGEVVTTKQRVSKGTTTKSVKYSVFVPMLIKAIQEQQEIINEMRAEIDSLKNQIK